MPDSNAHFECLTCRTVFDKPQPACNFCGEPTCFECRVKDAHVHTDQEKRTYLLGFCLSCAGVKVLKLLRACGTYRCVDCDYEWAPRAGRSLSHPSQYICPFCGALQASIIFPFNCGRCAMLLG